MIAKSAGVVLLALLLAGCWQSRGTLYAGMTQATPFHAGRVTETDDQKKIQHFTLRLDSHRTYRLVGDDKGTDGYGEGFALRFFPLTGAAPGIFVYEAVALDDCSKAPKRCGEANADAQRIYGLILARADGGDEIRPDCAKDAAASAPFGLKDSGGDSCDFRDRTTLEKALRRLAKRKKPAFFYALQ